MSKDDEERFGRVEQQIIVQDAPYRLSHFVDFPYLTHEQVNYAHDKKEISFGCVYNPDFLDVVGTKADIIINAIWTNLPYGLFVADIVIAIVLKKWILFLGVPFGLFGIWASSPHFRWRDNISGLGGLSFILSFFILDWPWSVIIGLMLFAQIFSWTAREHYRMVVEERALKSEIFFCYMFKNGYFLLKDNKTNKIFEPKLLSNDGQGSSEALF